MSDKTDTVVFIFGSIKTEPHAPSQRFFWKKNSRKREKLSCRILREKRLHSDSREKTGFEDYQKGQKKSDFNIHKLQLTNLRHNILFVKMIMLIQVGNFKPLIYKL